MTNKQIIIDGVDVSGCKYFANNKCLMLCATGTACDVYPYCYYKAYKAKEQECEFSNLRIIQLQETLSQYETDLSTKDCIVETCKAQYKELKAENDELKETFDGLFKVQYKLADTNKELRQCLTEIKEIAEHCMQQEVCFACDYYDNCYIEDEEIPTYDVCKVILQKISEVE